MSTTIRITGIPIHLLSPEERAAKIESFFVEPFAHHIVTVNPEFIVAASHNDTFREILTHASLATADGAGIVYLARLLGYPANLQQRLTGIALTEELLTLAIRHQYTVLIILPRKSFTSAAELSAALHEHYPGLRYHIATEESGEKNSFNDTQILFVALGSPRQELWIADQKKNFPQLRIAVGVGGTFDFISGKIQRAPHWLQAVGLEWLWRLMREPKRIRRIVNAVIVFPYLALTKKNL